MICKGGKSENQASHPFQRKMALISRRAIIRLSRLELLFALSEGSRNRFQKHQNPSQNRAFRGKTRRNKIMIKVLFVCHGTL